MTKPLLRRSTFSLLGLLLLLTIVWLLGPYFAFGGARPMHGIAGRVIATLLLLLAWTATALWHKNRELRGSRKLLEQVVGQADAPAVNVTTPAETADSAQLRQRFEDAIARLKKVRRSGGNLYRLPWYVIVGPPGSGKTTALVNSGLRFPMEQELGKRAIKGIGGTRNCDWWFTDEAVLLDTAGRYTTQDSDRIADGAGWAQFLQLLKRHRRRRPINGVLVAYSASDLMTRSAAEFDADVMAIRQRAAELYRHLGIGLPLYLLVTKVDLVEGFAEYFDNLDVTGRRQVWGVTFTLADSRRGRALRTLPAEVDALLVRLNQGLNQRLREERDTRRRSLLYGFPQQFGALKARLLELVEGVFGATEYDSRLYLRGVYFTSATQAGTPIDRLLGSLGHSFGLVTDSPASGPVAARAYFVERLLRDVILQETGLAGTNRRAELRNNVLHLAARAAVVVLAVGALIALAASFRTNATYLGEVAGAVAALEKTRSARIDGVGLARQLPQFEALRRLQVVATRGGTSAPWTMRAGLYQGRTVGEAARDAYSRELNAELVPALARAFEQRMDLLTGEPDRLYDYLEGYLMLADPKRLVPEDLVRLASVEWEREYPDQPQVPMDLVMHLETLLTSGRLQAATVDQALVTRARNALSAAASTSRGD